MSNLKDWNKLISNLTLCFVILVSLLGCGRDTFSKKEIKKQIQVNSDLLYHALTIVDKKYTAPFSVTRFKIDDRFNIRIKYHPSFPTDAFVGFRFDYDRQTDSLDIILKEYKEEIQNTDLRIDEWEILIKTVSKFSGSFFSKGSEGYTQLLIPNGGLNYYALIYKPDAHTFDILFYDLEFKEEIEHGLYLCKGTVN